MNDEIKEIRINTIEQLLDFVETEEKAKLLIDYITNLQQENEKLKDIIEHKPFFDFTTDIYDELEDYKSRVEKAVKYIMTELVDEWSIKNDGYVSGSDLPVDAIIPLLNILNGKE